MITISILVVAAVLMATVQCDRTPEERAHFDAWRAKFGKNYSNKTHEDEAMAKMLKNRDKINAHNKLYEDGKVTFKQALWKHSDMADSEKRNKMMGIQVPPQTRSAPVMPSLPVFPTGPDSLDWRQQGLVGPVHDQGGCGSCWAFSASGVVEGVIRKRNQTNVASNQQLVDCATKGCWGCSSGWPKFALDYVSQNGFANDDSYPYVAFNKPCTYNNSLAAGYINASHEVDTRGNETLLRDIVASVGPVSVVLGISNSFYGYSSGVYYEPNCTMHIDHAVLMVGYGTDPVGGDYWILKNSWGVSWGDQGYVKFARNRNNMCNIAYYAVYAS